MIRSLRPQLLRTTIVVLPACALAAILSLASAPAVPVAPTPDARPDGSADAAPVDAKRPTDALAKPDVKPPPVDAKLPWGDARFDTRPETKTPFAPDAIPLATDDGSG